MILFKFEHDIINKSLWQLEKILLYTLKYTRIYNSIKSHLIVGIKYREVALYFRTFNVYY